MLTCRSASPAHSFNCALLISLGTLASPAWSTPAADADAILAALPLPPDIAPPTEAGLKQGAPLKKLVLGKPVADGDFRSGFGIRRHPILRSSRMHTGVDWAARLGAPILSAGDGTVIKAERAAGYGQRVEIQHADDVVTTYSHMSRFGTDIAPGTKVHQGQVIGFVGSTGLSTGPHLHFEVLVNGDFVDPMDIYVGGRVRVAVKVEKTIAPAIGQAAVIPAKRTAALQVEQGPAAKTLPVVKASLAQTSPNRVQSGEGVPIQRVTARPIQTRKADEKWVEHDRRMRDIQSKVTSSSLMIMR